MKKTSQDRFDTNITQKEDWERRLHNIIMQAIHNEVDFIPQQVLLEMELKVSELTSWVANAVGEGSSGAETPDDNMSDVEADADTLKSAGWGTDEDYGLFSDPGDVTANKKYMNLIKSGKWMKIARNSDEEAFWYLMAGASENEVKRIFQLEEGGWQQLLQMVSVVGKGLSLQEVQKRIKKEQLPLAFQLLYDHCHKKDLNTTASGKAIYTDAERPCPKCGHPEHYILNPSMPIINECTKCGNQWNPDYQNETNETKNEAMCDNCGSNVHHAEECPYSFGANPQ